MKLFRTVVKTGILFAAVQLSAQAGTLLTIRGGIDYMLQEKPVVYEPGASVDARMYFFKEQDDLFQYGLTGRYLFLPTIADDSLSIIGLGGIFSLYKPFGSRFSVRLDASSGADGGLINSVLFGKYNTLNGTPWGVAFFAGADLFLNWYVHPDISLSADIGYKYSKGLYNGVHADVGVTFNIPATSPLLFIEHTQSATVIPAFRKYYLDHPVLRIDLKNNEHFSADDLSIKILSGSQNVAGEPVYVPELKAGEEVSVYVPVAWSKTFLQRNDTSSESVAFEILYKAGGKKRTIKGSALCVILGHNNFVWQKVSLENSETGDVLLDTVLNAPDGKAAVFVDPNDPDMITLVHRIQAFAQKNVSYEGLNANMRAVYQTAAYFQLRRITYQVDPDSVPYGRETNTTVDYLRYPFETLKAGYGDCDDLSILCAALLEAAGIKTAFITIPGHIYAAADSGMSGMNINRLFGNTKRFIEFEGVYYLPLEVTVFQKGLAEAWSSGLDEWNCTDPGNRRLYPLEKAWQDFMPDSPAVKREVSVWSPEVSYVINVRQARDELYAAAIEGICGLPAGYSDRETAIKYSQLAFCKFTFGKLDEAYADIQSALKLNPSYANYYNAGLIAWKLGKNTDAGQLLNKALALSSSGKAKETLDMINNGELQGTTAIASSDNHDGTARAGETGVVLSWEEE